MVDDAEHTARRFTPPRRDALYAFPCRGDDSAEDRRAGGVAIWAIASSSPTSSSVAALIIAWMRNASTVDFRREILLPHRVVVTRS